MFGFRIRYLTGTLVAADVITGNEKSRVEWPPHPDRLFSALVQAWGDLGEPEDAKLALEWLEALPPPHVYALDVRREFRRTNVTRYVPANDPSCDEMIPSRRGRNPRRLPSAWVGDAPVDVCWPNVDPGDHLGALTRLAAAVSSLGHPSSLVTVGIDESTRGTSEFRAEGDERQELVPDPDGSLHLRVPRSGRLAHLIWQYHREPRQRPTLGAWMTYSPSRPVVQTASGVFRDLLVFRLKGNGRLPLVSTSQVIRAFRGSILSHADQPVPEVVSGHGPQSTPKHPCATDRVHLALIPLPDVGHMHARGHLLGVAAVLTGELDSEDRTACLRAVGAAGRSPLVVGHQGAWTLERQTLEVTLHALRPDTWTHPSRSWATVTPFVFGRYPRDPYGEDAVEIVRDSCRMVRLPEPVEIELGPVSPVLGVPRASEFPALASRPGKPRKYHVHVKLVFSELVAGPILLGWGRYQGYGLCRPQEVQGYE